MFRWGQSNRICEGLKCTESKNLRGSAPDLQGGSQHPLDPQLQVHLSCRWVPLLLNSIPLLKTATARSCWIKAWKRVKNVSFSENSAYALSERSHIHCCNLFMIWFDLIFTMWIGRASQDEQLYVFIVVISNYYFVINWETKGEIITKLTKNDIDTWLCDH